MPKVLNVILCSQASLEPGTNNVTLSGIAEQIGVPRRAFESAAAGEPAFAGPITLVALFSWQWPKVEKPEIISIDLYVNTAGGKRHLIQGSMDINTPIPLPRCRFIAKIGGFPIDIPGVYVFALEARGEVVAEIPLEVDSIEADNSGAQALTKLPSAPTKEKSAPRKRRSAPGR